MPTTSRYLVKEIMRLKFEISNLELERSHIILNSFGGASGEDAVVLGANIAKLKVELALWQLAKSIHENDLVRAYKYCNQLYIARASLVDVAEDVAEDPEMLPRDIVMGKIGQYIDDTGPFDPKINEQVPNIIYLTRIYRILIAVEICQTN